MCDLSAVETYTDNCPVGETGVSESRKCTAASNGARKVRGRAAAKTAPATTELEAEPPEPTEYAKNRPRREVQGPKATLGHTTESLELVKCMDFVGPAGSGAPLAQPFQVYVQAQVWPAPHISHSSP